LEMISSSLLARVDPQVAQAADAGRRNLEHHRNLKNHLLGSPGPIDPTIDFPPIFFYKEKYIIEVKIWSKKGGVTVFVFDLRGVVLGCFLSRFAKKQLCQISGNNEQFK
jgi:hypothetical protein